jgi:hypothetical protein
VLDEVAAAGIIQLEVAVTESASVRQHVERALESDGGAHDGASARHVHCKVPGRALVAQRDAQLLRPEEPAAERVALVSSQTGDASRGVRAQRHRERGPPALLDPGAAPRRQVRGVRASRMAMRSGHVAFAVLESLEIVAQAVAEDRLAHHLLQLTHHHRRLVVDDRAVHLAGFVQVAQRLPDRIAAGRAIHLVRRTDSDPAGTGARGSAAGTTG